MFFSILTMDKNDDRFSYLLCKKPGSVFERDRIRGEYTSSQVNSSVLNDKYTIITTPTFSSLLPLLKERNEESYNSYQHEGVTPYYLNSIFECLRSAFIANYKDETDIQESTRVRSLMFEIGPFIYDYGNIKELFNAFGFNVFKGNTFSSDPTGLFEVAYSLLLSCESTLQLALQKVFILSLFSTFKHNMFPISNEQLEKYIRMCSSWLEGDNPFAKTIIRTLCKSNKTMENKFIEAVVDDEDDQTELKEKLYIGFKTLHSLRHDWICKQVGFIRQQSYDKAFTIVDYGCANGKLSLKINDHFKKNEDLNFKIYAYDASEKAGRSLQKVSHVDFHQMNLLYPNMNDIPRNIDILLLSEIIEHFNGNERKQIYDYIVNVMNPRYIIFTTPNRDYNTKLGIPEGQYRDKGHKIEFNFEEYRDELLVYFCKNNYSCVLTGIELKEEKSESIFHEWGTDPDTWGNEYLDSPSILTVFTNNDTDRKLPFSYKTTESHAPVYLPVSDYLIESKEISNGYCDNAFINNGDNIFYVAPTVPPIDYKETEYGRYIEHPSTVFQYYKDRGVTELVAEKKYMGSRAHILMFKNDAVARKFGKDRLIYINTRNGNRFFDNYETELEFYNSLPEFKYDVVMLDAEMMPWRLKAEWLIRNKFQGIGECAYLNRKYKNDKDGLANAESFLSILRHYTKESDAYARVFNILALGRQYGNKYDWVVGKEIDNVDKMKYIHELSSEKFKPVESHYINLSNPTMVEDEIDDWTSYCANGGEGKVYKPLPQRMYDSNGYLIQPMVKCRGRDYLRLIYGIDYLEDENFEIVKNRKTKMKRILSIQETELSDIILSSFIHNRKLITKRLIAGFLGMETINFSNVDRTL